MEEGKNCNRRSSAESGRMSRSKALGVIALMLGLFIFQVTVFIVEKTGALSDSGKQAENWRNGSVKSSPDNTGSSSYDMVKELFEFDPNTITLDSLCRLGLTEKQAQSIIKYRDKGGRFRRREDFARMYVIDSSMYKRLSGYIVIKEEPKRAEKVGNIGRTGKNVELKKVGKMGDVESAGKVEGAGNVVDTAIKERRQAYKPKFVVELNSADSLELVKLYGIGGYYARKIILHRERIGGFYAPEQLMEIEGIDSVRFARFAKNVTADVAAVRRFSFDTAGKVFLSRHPYIGPYAARGIVLMREKFGAAACTLENLVKERLITKTAAEKLWHYVY